MNIFSKKIKQIKKTFSFHKNHLITVTSIRNGYRVLEEYLRLTMLKQDKSEIIDDKFKEIVGELLYQLTHVEGYRDDIRIDESYMDTYSFLESRLLNFEFPGNILMAICRLSQYELKEFSNGSVEEIMLYDELSLKHGDKIGIIENMERVRSFNDAFKLSIKKLGESIKEL